MRRVREIVYKQTSRRTSRSAPSATSTSAAVRKRLELVLDAGSLRSKTRAGEHRPAAVLDSKRYASGQGQPEVRNEAKLSSPGSAGSPAARSPSARSISLHGRIDGERGGREGDPRLRAATDRACRRSSFASARPHAGGHLLLMQMAKSSARWPFPHVQKPYISVLLDPTPAAGRLLRLSRDVILAEPRALIGFSLGRGDHRPSGRSSRRIQTSEFLLKHGWWTRSSTAGDARPLAQLSACCL